MNLSLKTLTSLMRSVCTMHVLGVFFLWLMFSSHSLSAQTTQTKSVIDNGGNRSGATSFVHFSSVGQTLVGSGSSTSYGNSSGFEGGGVEVSAAAAITDSSFPDTHVQGSSDVAITLTVDDEALVDDVSFFFKGLSTPDDDFGEQTGLNSNGSGVYTATLTDANFADDIGVTYFFEVTSLNGAIQTSNIGITYLEIADAEQALSGLRFGSAVSDYQIISVPYVLTDRSVLSVFDELAPYDDTKWRLFHYSGGETNEFSSFSNIDVGQGYWLIVADQTTITLGAGSVSRVTNAAPYEITLQAGWNQIGNPYTFTIAWDLILTANGDPGGIGNMFQLSGSTLGQANTLSAFRGGFVENTSGSPVTIQIPLDKNSIGGRANSSDEGIKQPIDKEEWEVGLKLTDGVFTNAIGGIGMRTGASEGQDRFDVSGFPAPFDLAEIRFANEDIQLSKSIVPRSTRQIWDFEITGLADQVELIWDNSYFGENEMHLVLLDLDANKLVDMRDKSQLLINLNRSRNFKIIYGEEEFVANNALPVSVGLGDIYPNPFNTIVNIPFTLNGGNVLTYKVDLKVYDMGGREITNLAQKSLQAGFHQVIWQPDLSLPKGIYHVILEVKNGSKEWKLNKKIIFK